MLGKRIMNVVHVIQGMYACWSWNTFQHLHSVSTRVCREFSDSQIITRNTRIWNCKKPRWPPPPTLAIQNSVTQSLKQAGHKSRHTYSDSTFTTPSYTPHIIATANPVTFFAFMGIHIFWGAIASLRSILITHQNLRELYSSKSLIVWPPGELDAFEMGETGKSTKFAFSDWEINMYTSVIYWCSFQAWKL